MDDTISRQAAIKEIARWTGYIDEDMILRIQTGLKKLPSADAEKIAVEYCMKHCLVMISMASYETLVAYYGRANGLLFDERMDDANERT